MGYLMQLIIESFIAILLGVIIGRIFQTYDRLNWLYNGKYNRRYKLKMFLRFFIFGSDKCVSCCWNTVHGKEFCKFSNGIYCGNYVNDDSQY